MEVIDRPREEYLTVLQIAKELHVGKHLVNGWIRSGELRAMNLTSNPRAPTRSGYRIARSDLEAFLARRTATQEA